MSVSLCISLCLPLRARPICDGCDAPLTRGNGRRETPDGLGVLCVACYLAHTRGSDSGPAARADPGGLEAA